MSSGFEIIFSWNLISSLRKIPCQGIFLNYVIMVVKQGLIFLFDAPKHDLIISTVSGCFDKVG
jgi:hypothetical protein